MDKYGPIILTDLKVKKQSNVMLLINGDRIVTFWSYCSAQARGEYRRTERLRKIHKFINQYFLVYFLNVVSNVISI